MSSFVIPGEWGNTTLETCVDILDSRRVPVNNTERQARIQNKSPDQLYPYFGATGEVGKIDDYLFNEELVALGEDGVPFLDPRKPKAYMLVGKTWVNNHAHVLRACEGVTTNKFLLHYLNQVDYQGFVNGGTRLKLTQANMQRIPFSVPPLAEQKAIADKLDTLLAQVETTKARLEHIPQILKRFRQSVLAAAVSGRLTEEWSFTELKLSEIAEFQNGYAFKSGWFESSGTHQVVKLGNIRDGYLELKNSPAYVSDKLAREFSRYTPDTGDTLISMTGTRFKKDYGFGCMIKDGEYLLINQRVGRVIPDRSKLNPEFLTMFIRSDLFRDQFFGGETGGVNQGNVGSKHILSILIQVPSKDVQDEIVRQVNQLFAHADRIEQQVQAAQERVNNLTQSILAKAFRGELTEQWRKDNPDLISGENSAAALLEKIKAKRKTLKPVKATRARKVT